MAAQINSNNTMVARTHRGIFFIDMFGTFSGFEAEFGRKLKKTLIKRQLSAC